LRTEEDFLNVRGRNLDSQKCTFYAKKNLYAGRPGLFPAISAQFTL